MPAAFFGGSNRRAQLALALSELGPTGAKRVVLIGPQSEDEEPLRDLLRAAGFEVVEVPDCQAALSVIERYDLVMADCSEGADLAQLAEAILGEVASNPEAGPFGARVALVPPAALLSRQFNQAAGSGTLKVRDLEIDLGRCEVNMQGRRVDLTPTEFRMLRHLALNAGKVLSAAELLRGAQEYPLDWNDQDAQEVVKVHIRHIRHKLEPSPQAPSYILNVRGFGYMLERREGER